MTTACVISSQGVSTMQDRVYRAKVRDVDDLKQRLIDVWDSLEQSVIDDAIDQWHSPLDACVRAKGDISNSLCNLRLNFVIGLHWHFDTHWVAYWSWMYCFNMKMPLFVTTAIFTRQCSNRFKVCWAM